MIKLVALDLDGTLLNSSGEIDTDTCETIRRYARQGTEFAFCTGRSSCELVPFAALLPEIHYAVTCNGAYAVDLTDGYNIYENLIPMDEVRSIYQSLCDFDMLFELFADGTVYSPEPALRDLSRYEVPHLESLIRETRQGISDFPEFIASRTDPVGKINIFFPGAAYRDQARIHALSLPYDISYQEKTNLEFNKQGVNKGDGLAQLIRYIGISPTDVMAIGDNNNDLTMGRAADLFIAMGNACEELKHIADYITADNNSSGVAKAIRKFVV
ncbi:Cof-type HAD-IIB family hydrolase [Anaerolentibacter hominis]|uniref:Cof-type HAD-IIB family hydrolase n=1 Tax=Anaerolentibacter hominis TaxID=3079009 RepID=UPI0031B87EBE